MGKTRLEAFSDGVIAIIITIMVLELKVPHGASWEDLQTLAPIFLSYVLSFVNVGIYWNNHHHLIHTVKKVTGGILWANLHLLFWLSLLPFTTGWMGENHFATLPCIVYALNLFLAGASFNILAACIVRTHGQDSVLAQVKSRNPHGKAGHYDKGTLSLVAYALSIPAAWLGHTWLAETLWVGVALMWLVPDRRIEKLLSED